MKKLIFILIFILTCCGVSKNIYFEQKTPTPQVIIDSLSNKHLLDITDYKDWIEIQYFGNDSVITSIYTKTLQNNDSLYIFSITEKENQDSVLLRFRREHK